MRAAAIAAGAICLFAAPANAERLKVYEVYQHLQGDWAQIESSSTDAGAACAMTRQRLSLDATGLVLTVQDMTADQSTRSYAMKLKAIPNVGDAGVELDFFGPDVDYTRDLNVWQEQLSISMTNADRMDFYLGYAKAPPYSDADGRMLVRITPHGYGVELIRCSLVSNASPTLAPAPG